MENAILIRSFKGEFVVKINLNTLLKVRRGIFEPKDVARLLESKGVSVSAKDIFNYKLCRIL